MTDPRCNGEYNNGTLHVHDNKCRPCRHYKTCEYIKFLETKRRKKNGYKME